jgi:suppressor of ftsI
MVPASQMARYPNTSSEEQVFDGLSGLIEVQGLTNDLPVSLRRLPERYLALRDVQISNGAIVSQNIDSNAPTTQLVNGHVHPRITIAPGQTQLWHIANIGADIFYHLSLPGHTFDVVAQDGHPLLHAQAPADTQRLPHAIFHGTLNLARMPIVRQRIVTLSEDSDGSMFFINEEFYEPSKINFYARLNTVEQWVIVNSTDELHVFHMHTHPMQVISANGVPTPFNGYQDEVDLPPHGYVVARFHFTATPVSPCSTVTSSRTRTWA